MYILFNRRGKHTYYTFIPNVGKLKSEKIVHSQTHKHITFLEREAIAMKNLKVGIQLYHSLLLC